jgi:hypothetical protein
MWAHYNVTWTLPAGILSQEASIWANTSTGASYFQLNKSLLSTATSALFGLGTPLTSGTVTNAGVWLGGVDNYGRQLSVNQSISVR